jgi:hypothetical protein
VSRAEELWWIQKQLEVLAHQRSDWPLTSDEENEYERLAGRELELLRSEAQSRSA